jgi:hypothetical protein
MGEKSDKVIKICMTNRKLCILMHTDFEWKKMLPVILVDSSLPGHVMHAKMYRAWELRFHETKVLNEQDHSWIIWILFSFTMGGHSLGSTFSRQSVHHEQQSIATSINECSLQQKITVSMK